MNDLPILLLLLLGGQRAKCPTWPSTASPPPPPPLPAAMPPAADAAPPDTTATPSKVPLQTPIPPMPPGIRKYPARPKPPPPRGGGGRFGGGGATGNWAKPGPEMDVSVADVQKVLIKRGATIVKDGLYGPKTASAWALMAKLNKLSPKIERRTGKIARVATSTFTALAGPVIP